MNSDQDEVAKDEEKPTKKGVSGVQPAMPRTWRIAHMGDSHNNLGLRDSEDEPIALPLHTPGARIVE